LVEGIHSFLQGSATHEYTHFVTTVTASDIEQASAALQGVVRQTPMDFSERLSTAAGVPVYLKREDLQVCRSFKARGAFNNMSHLSDAEKQLGVVCASAGNHAQGVANACKALGIQGTIYLPQSAPRQKRERIKAIGGSNVTLKFVEGPFDRAQEVALADASNTWRTYIHPYDDPLVIAGQGTVALELVAQLPKVSTVLVPVGGGGLIAGVASFLRHASPDTRIIGVEPAGAACVSAALRAHEPVTLDAVDPFVDGTAVGRAGNLTFELVRSLVDEVVVVPEGAVATEMLDLYHLEGVIAEPAGALASAAIVAASKGRVKSLNLTGPTAAIISGGNNDLSRYAEVMERSMTYLGLRHYFLVTFPQQPGALRLFLDQVLGPGDDIVHFEYTKKNNRDTGPALVGIDVQDPDDVVGLRRRMDDSPLNIQTVEQDSELLRFLL